MRDKLIQVERLHLAVEVSTKCGLDPAGVWGAWGMNCLLSGDFPGAREKFSRCLKVSKEVPPPQLLDDREFNLLFLPASPKAKAGLGVQSLRLSVRLSVRPSVPKSCHRNSSETTDSIIMKLGMWIGHHM